MTLKREQQNTDSYTALQA